MLETSFRVRLTRFAQRVQRRRLLLLVAGLMALAGAACGSEADTSATDAEPDANANADVEGASEGENSLALTSSAFGEGEVIPERYTCDGEDVSPPLAWERGPAGTVTYALVMDDPDAPAGTWVHWVLFNLPDDRRQLAEDVTADAGAQGTNSWGRTGYGGPCPPSGQHRYLFKLYALDTELALEAGADKETLLAAMEGHVLANGQLTGVYER